MVRERVAETEIVDVGLVEGLCEEEVGIEGDCEGVSLVEASEE